MNDLLKKDGLDTGQPSECITFADVYNLYRDEIVSKLEDSTRGEYEREIEDYILPYFKDKPLSKCNLAFYKNVIAQIRKNGTIKSKGKRKHKDKTIDRYAYYIECIVRVASNHGVCENLLWCTDFRAKRKRIIIKKKREVYTELRRALTPEEICKIVKLIFSDHLQTGQKMALLLMLVCGLRNKEACGLVFGDIEEIIDHPGCYVLVIHNSTEGTGHKLKPRGKNIYMYRRIPIPKSLYDFLMLRKKHISELLDLYQTIVNNREHIDIDTLPIACDGHNWRVHCSSPQVTDAGRTLFAEIGYPEDAYWEAECLSGEEDSGYKQYKDPTAYIFRRNFATMLSWFCFSTIEAQYLMGHAFKDKTIDRSVFNNPDRQYDFYRILSQRPLKPPFDLSNTHLEYSGGILELDVTAHATITIHEQGQYLIKVVGNHPDDPLNVTFNSQDEDDITGHYTISPSLASMPDEICLLRDYIELYVAAWNKLCGDEMKETGD